jgi:teichoic acid transport system permease protein
MTFKKTTQPARILAEHAGFQRQIVRLAWMDIRKSYRGAFLGWLWVIIQPLIMLGFYWFIIAIGLHSDKVVGKKYEYLPWLITGLCSWFFVSSMINSGVGAFRRYKFLVVRTKFPVATIPTIILISNLIVHGILLTIVLAYLYSQGYAAVQWVQLPVYIIFTMLIMWFWALLAAPLGAISKDFTQLVKSLMRVLVWISGILWSIHNVHIHWLREIMLLNPIYIIAEGYRKSLIYHQWFFKDRKELIVFLAEVLVLGICAVTVYKRSRKELADVL